MKFLLDMGLARSTGQFLRSEGHDAIHLRDLGLQRMSDEKIIEKAIAEDRIILTHDLDFSRLVAVGQSRLPSVITFRLKDMRPIQVNAYLSETLARFEIDLRAGALISVSDGSIRSRRLPIAS